MPHESGSPPPLDAAGLLLVRAEETIALVARATPKNSRTEIQRLSALAVRRGSMRPAFDYKPVPELLDVRRGLERIARASLMHGSLGVLHAARAEELELEARLVETVGRPGFAELAAQRFSAPRGALHERVMDFVEHALAETAPVSAASCEMHRSDDLASPASLVRKVARMARELGLPLRVETRPDQLAIAATGHGIVAVRPGALLSADAASRIALHEILGHALPRMRSHHAPWSLLRAGTVGSVEAEEGRALLVERRAGHLDWARRRELAFRHIGALSVRRGADFDETFRELAARGADALEAVEIAVRVHRGGGLGREIVYLPAYHDVARAFDREPALERWFERGRVGLAAANVFAALELGSAIEAPASGVLTPGRQNPACTV